MSENSGSFLLLLSLKFNVKTISRSNFIENSCQLYIIVFVLVSKIQTINNFDLKFYKSISFIKHYFWSKFKAHTKSGSWDSTGSQCLLLFFKVIKAIKEKAFFGFCGNLRFSYLNFNIKRARESIMCNFMVYNTFPLAKIFCARPSFQEKT